MGDEAPWADAAFDEQLRSWRVIPDRLRYWTREIPDAPFLQCDAGWLTYREVDALSDRVAAGLAEHGVRKGDRVSIILPNCDEMLVAFFACAKLGAIQVPVNIFLRGPFLAYQLKDAQAGTVIADEPGVRALQVIAAELPDLARVFQVGDASPVDGPVPVLPYRELQKGAGDLPDVQIAMTDLNAILYTSGTTGMPKGCMMSHGFYLNVARTYYRCGLARPSDRLFTSWPLFHTSGQMIALMIALQGGLSIHYEREFSARRFIQQAAAADATMIFGVGAMGMAMLQTPPADGDRDHRIRGASLVPMAPHAQLAFEERFGIPVYSEIYGQTECNPISASPWREADRKRSSLGRSIAELEIEVHDDTGRQAAVGEVGELVIRPREPEVMFQGYWNKPVDTLATFRGLWHHTGDNAVLDKDGYLTFWDRKSDSMRRRGENVSSIELEQAIATHPAVAQVAVHAVASSLGEDDIKACLVALPGHALEPAELFSFFAAKLPYFAVPRYVEVLDTLPANAMGRVLKHQLRARGVGAAWDFEEMGLVVDKANRR
jgi:crotonobetaine/carnitine-CoA ligase